MDSQRNGDLKVAAKTSDCYQGRSVLEWSRAIFRRGGVAQILRPAVWSIPRHPGVGHNFGGPRTGSLI